MNKNLKLDQNVRIEFDPKVETGLNEHLNGKTGSVVGFEAKPGRFGLTHFYIVLLDKPYIGMQWKAITLQEYHLKPI